jgi:hypothetical protein
MPVTHPHPTRRTRMPWLVFAMALICVDVTAAAADLFVVTAQPSQLSASLEIQEIMTGRTRKWPDGTPIVVALPSKESPYFEDAGKAWFDGSASAMQRHWLRLVFSGRANVPIYTKSDEEAMAILEANPAAIVVMGIEPPPTFNVMARLN